MVTTRLGQTNAALLQKKCEEYFGLMGRDDFVITNFGAPTKNEKGRITSQPETIVTGVLGDLQFSVKVIQPYIALGIAQQGDGIFYTGPLTVLKVADEVVVDDSTWETISQVEGETMPDGGGGASQIYTGWIVRRKPLTEV